MTRRTPAANTLFYGDNLRILRDYVEDESVDLVYLDPPFNSNATYNVLFKAPDGERSQSQIEAFEDTWHWNESAERAFDAVMTGGNSDAAEMLRAMRSFLKENDMMAYLAMMAVRLLELHRVLKPTGSLYLHCDPTASHYLKILLDAVFGKASFLADISWRRTSGRSMAKRWPRIHDNILYYAKDEEPKTFNVARGLMDENWLLREYRFEDEIGRYMLADLTGAGLRFGESGKAWRGIDPAEIGAGRHWRYGVDRLDELDALGAIYWPKKGRYPKLKSYLKENGGSVVGDMWSDIGVIGRTANERLGYPTQKPLALLERILSASSNEGDLVLDPFCGCGTTVHAAQKLGRRWIGIDITHLAVGLVKRRLTEAFPRAQFQVLGVPKDIGAAQALAAADKHQFELWALSMVEAIPYKGGRKGADGGVDGYIYFKPDGRVTEKAVVSVKGGGNVGVGMIRDLIATIEREKAKVGIFLTLEDPTTRMRQEAAAAGLYDSGQEVGGRGETRKHPRIQILTVENLFEGRRPDLPWIDGSVFRKARREKEAGDPGAGQGDLGV